MDDSPQLLSKRSKRLSLKKPSKVSDSPKTPHRVTDQSNLFSTPLNSYKRSCNVEESPSHEYDSDSALICTQEAAQKNIVDVAWKWEEQSPKVGVLKLSKPRKVEKIKIPPLKQVPKKSILLQSPDVHQSKGFFKFKEEFLRDFKDGNEGSSSSSVSNHDESLFNDMNELDSSLKENETYHLTDTKNIHFGLDKRKHIIESIPVTNDKSEPYSMKCDDNEVIEVSHQHSNEIIIANNRRPETTPCATPQKTDMGNIKSNLLEDTDSDDLLLLCSQQVEASYHNQIKRKKIEKQDSIFANDSLDDIFLSVAVDLPVSSSSTTYRSPLVRHNSMPVRSPVTKLQIQRTPINFQRHNSMPTADQKPVESKISPEVISISSSTESINSEKRRCTPEEIERKRLEAIQRRQASRVRPVSGSGAVDNQPITNKFKK